MQHEDSTQRPLTRRSLGLAGLAGLIATPRKVAAQARAPTATLPATSLLGASMGQLGDHLLRAAIAADSNGNHLLSPWSVHAVLGLLALGARGPSWPALAGLLGMRGRPQTELAGALRAARRGLAVGPAVTLNRAEAAWVRMPLRFEATWQALAQQALDARGRRLDFGAPTIIRDINGWVAKQTKGMITEVLDRLPDGADFILASAIHFHGRWSTPFAAEATAPQEFTSSVGNVARVPMMGRQATSTLYGQAGSGHAVVLPYAGDEIAMVIATSVTRETVRAFQAEIEAKGIVGYLRSVAFERHPVVGLRLPRFGFDAGADLLPALDQLAGGLIAARGDFSGVTGRPAFVDAVSHRARIRVDEQGTVASAATAVIGMRSARLDVPLFVADRPFALLVTTWPRGREAPALPLFAGFVGDVANAQSAA